MTEACRIPLQHHSELAACPSEVQFSADTKQEEQLIPNFDIDYGWKKNEALIIKCKGNITPEEGSTTEVTVSYSDGKVLGSAM